MSGNGIPSILLILFLLLVSSRLMLLSAYKHVLSQLCTSHDFFQYIPLKVTRKTLETYVVLLYHLPVLSISFGRKKVGVYYDNPSLYYVAFEKASYSSKS